MKEIFVGFLAVSLAAIYFYLIGCAVYTLSRNKKSLLYIDKSFTKQDCVIVGIAVSGMTALVVIFFYMLGSLILSGRG